MISCATLCQKLTSKARFSTVLASSRETKDFQTARLDLDARKRVPPIAILAVIEP